MVKYPKHFLVLGGDSNTKQGYVYEIGNDIVIEKDKGNVYNTMSFTLPYIDTGNFSTKNLKKYDIAKLYLREYNTPQERDSANIDEMTLFFNGFIDTIALTENKDGGKIYSITCKTVSALTYERTVETKLVKSNIKTIFTEFFRQSNLADILSYEVLGITDEFIFDIDSSKQLGKIFDSIKEKYAVNIYTKNNGVIRVTIPTYFIQQTQYAEIFDLKQNCFSIDHGQITQKTNMVIVLGNNCFGIAFDPVAYQLQLGIAPADIDVNIQPDALYSYPRYVFRRDLLSSEDCQTVAKNMLVELAKNYAITLTVPISVTRELGDLFFVQNCEEIPNNQKWIIQKETININKEGYYSTITGYSTSTVDFPEDILINPKTGFLDTDILEVTDKVENAINLD